MSSLDRRACTIATGLAAVLAAACFDGTGPERSATNLAVVSGDGQFSLPGGQVPRPLVVRATDSTGQPAAGVVVRWSPSGGSQFVSDTSTTDANGIASAVWILGPARTGYSAQAAATGSRDVSFAAQADSGDIIVTAQPDTARFTALDDTVRMRLRVRSARMKLDTIIDPRGWSSPANPSASGVYDGKGGLLLRSVHNGTSSLYAFFGTVPALFVTKVQQVPTDVRIVRAGTTLAATDSIPIGPDTTNALAVMSVDHNGRIIEGSSAFGSVTWTSSVPEIASVSATGVLSGIIDGVTQVSAKYGAAETHTLVRVWTLRPFAIATGGGGTCAVSQAHPVACWGFREVGNNSLLNIALVPELRPTWPAFVSISMSDNGSCGVTASGAGYCWGQNQIGQLGIGSAGAYVAAPVAVAGGIEWASISAGAGHMCGLSTAGRAYCWGSAFEGLLGDGTYGVMKCVTPVGSGWCTPTPTEVTGHQVFTQVTTSSGGHACGLAVDGIAYCWGTNRYGQLGSPRIPCLGYTGNTATSSNWCSTVPVAVDGGHKFTTISAGITHACGVTTEAKLYCWGLNLAAVMGVEGISDSVSSVNPVPLAVAPNVSFSSVYSGRGHTCALDTDGAAWCWGQASVGQLGIGRTPSSSCVNGSCERTPVKVAGNLRFKTLSVGAANTCGLTVNDVAWCWGSGNTGVLGNGATTVQTSPTRVAFQKR